MLRTSLFAFVAIALWLLSGCGGGGGGGGNNNGGGGANIASGQYIEFFDGGGNWIDPFDLSAGQTGTAVLVNYDSLGNRTVMPPTGSGYQTTAPGGAVTINPATGVFTIVGTPVNEFKFQCTTMFLGTPTLFEQRARTPLVSSVVNGRFTELNIFTGLPSGTGIPHLNVDFYNAGGTLVGSARTMADGRFSARIPTTAVEMMVDANSIKQSRYYRSVYYDGDTYSPLDTTCRIPVTVGAGTTNLLTGGIALVSGSPPPPPTGCS